MSYLIYDTETTGLEPPYNLLTAYFLVVDDNYKELGHLDLKVKPDNGQYIVHPKALAVNKISLADHDQNALTYSTARDMVCEFLAKHSKIGKNMLTPVGHNVFFDETFVKHYLVPPNIWGKYVSHRKICTQVIANFLKLSGHFPADLSVSLDSLRGYYKLSAEDAHTAKQDVLDTLTVLVKMSNMVSLEGAAKVPVASGSKKR